MKKYCSSCIFLTCSELPDVISVTPNQHHDLMTTRSWDFLGMNLDHQPPSKLLQRSKYGEDVIIGIVDTGQSFTVNKLN